MDREGSLEEGMVTHFSILAWRIPWTGAWWAAVPEVTQEVDTTEATAHVQACNTIKMD